MFVTGKYRIFSHPAFLRRRRKKAKEGFAIDGVFFINQVFYQSGFQNWYSSSVARQHVHKNKTEDGRRKTVQLAVLAIIHVYSELRAPICARHVQAKQYYLQSYFYFAIRIASRAAHAVLRPKHMRAMRARG